MVFQKENLLKVKNNLSDFLGGKDQENKFSILINKIGARVAGGFILKSINDEDMDSTDLDIYVPCDKAIQLLNFFYLLPTDVSLLNSIQAPAYDQSFMFKNKIMKRISLRIDISDKIDIMCIEQGYPVDTVVNNFDLTFCEVSYDGNDVSGNITDALEKSGKLNDEYRTALIVYRNSFIQKRIRKYLKRGYHIEMSTDMGDIALEISKREISSSEAWVSMCIYKLLQAQLVFKGNYVEQEYNRIIWSCNYDLSSYTFEALETLISKIDFSIDDIREVYSAYRTYEMNVEEPTKLVALALLLIYDWFFIFNLIKYGTKYLEMISEYIGVDVEWVMHVRDHLSRDHHQILEDVFENIDVPDYYEDMILNKKPIMNASRVKKLMKKVEAIPLQPDNILEMDLVEDCENILELLKEDDNNQNDLIDDADAAIESELNKLKNEHDEANALYLEKRQPLEEFTKRYEILHPMDPLNPSLHVSVFDHAGYKEEAERLRDYAKDSFSKSRALHDKIIQFKNENKEVLSRIKEIRDKGKYINNKQFIQDSNHFLFVVQEDDLDRIICFDMENLINIIANKNEWLVECIGELIKATNDRKPIFPPKNDATLYVGIPINTDNLRAFIPVGQIKSLLEMFSKGLRIFYLKPAEGDAGYISHTASYKNSYNLAHANYVSANHCQGGSAIVVYDIKICEGDWCSLSKETEQKPAPIYYVDFLND